MTVAKKIIAQNAIKKTNKKIIDEYYIKYIIRQEINNKPDRITRLIENEILVILDLCLI